MADRTDFRRSGIVRRSISTPLRQNPLCPTLGTGQRLAFPVPQCCRLAVVDVEAGGNPLASIGVPAAVLRVLHDDDLAATVLDHCLCHTDNHSMDNRSSKWK